MPTTDYWLNTRQSNCTLGSRRFGEDGRTTGIDISSTQDLEFEIESLVDSTSKPRWCPVLLIIAKKGRMLSAIVSPLHREWIVTVRVCLQAEDVILHEGDRFPNDLYM